MRMASDNSAVMMDEGISSQNTWPDEVMATIMEITKENVTTWCKMLMNLGMEKKDRDSWTTIFIDQIKGLYADMNQEVKDHQNRVLDDIEELLKKSEMLCKQLHVKMPEYGSNDLSLYQEQKFLKEQIQKYEKEVKEKLDEIEELNKQQKQLCYVLGKPLKPIPTSPLPTPKFISEFRGYLENLESEKFERDEKFLSIKGSIIDIVNQLNFKPSLDFEKAVISADDSLFLVTDSNMRQLSAFHDELKQLLEDTNEEIVGLREKIKNLWELLAEDLRECDKFLQKHPGSSLDTLEALRKEAHRCNTLKKANIEVFVKRLRQELVELWHKCHISENERDFKFFATDIYTEDLLTLHDIEIDKLKQYYEENRELFALLEKREELWSKMICLEERANAPDRYKNRGGQLLKEEKERNALSKHIPEIENQLLQLAKEYTSRTGKPFLSWGNTIDNIIHTAHVKHEEEKKIRLTVRKQMRITPGKSMMELTPCKSIQNLAQPTSTASSAKRKLITTPVVPSKRTCILEKLNKHAPQSGPAKLAVNTGRSRYSMERAKRIEKCRRISKMMMQKRMDKENNLSSSTEDYGLFQKELQSKEGCRSTVFCDPEDARDQLAVPLSATPLRSVLARSCNKSPRTPKMSTKLSTACSLKLLF